MAALTFGLIATSSGHALAQGEEELERAKELFAEAAKAEKAGDCGAAAEKLEAVLAIKQTPQVWMRLGRCQDELGQLVEAETSYQEAVKLAAGEPDVLAVAEELLAKLSPRVPTLEFTKTDDIEGIEVVVDGEAVDPGASLRVNPGKHEIVATAPGYDEFRLTATMAAGDDRTVSITLTKRDEQQAPTPPTSVDEEPFPLVPVLFIGGGVALLGGGVVSLVVAEGLASDVDDACNGDRASCDSVTDPDEQAEIEDKVGQTDLFRGLGIGLLVGGAAAAATGIVLLMTEDGDEGQVDVGITSVAPLVIPGPDGSLGSGVWATGRF